MRSVVYNSLSATVDKFGKFVSSVLRSFALFKFTGSLARIRWSGRWWLHWVFSFGVKYEWKECFGFKISVGFPRYSLMTFWLVFILFHSWMADFMNDSLEGMLWQGNSIKGCYEGILLHKFVKWSETYQSNILTKLCLPVNVHSNTWEVKNELIY